MCKALKLLFTYIASHPILETPRVLEEGVQEGISRALTRFREESMGALEGRLDSVQDSLNSLGAKADILAGRVDDISSSISKETHDIMASFRSELASEVLGEGRTQADFLS